MCPTPAASPLAHRHMTYCLSVSEYVIRFCMQWLHVERLSWHALQIELLVWWGRGAQSPPHSVFLTWPCPEVSHESRRLESDPDAVDEHDFLCALLCSSYSTTFCSIAFWTVNRWISQWFHPSLRPRQFLQFLHEILGIFRHTGFSLQIPSPKRIAKQGWGLHQLFPRFCLLTYCLL